MKFNYKSRKGFTLIELLVVIGILAVLAAIAIPSVAGLIDRANVSADNTNASEMTNAMERFVSEYELFRQDIASGTFDKDNMDATQSRVYNVTKAETRTDIEKLESKEGLNGIRIDIDNKYAQNHETAKAVMRNYMKTSSSTFEPKQSDMTYWYNTVTGYTVVAEKDTDTSTLYTKLPTQVEYVNNTPASINEWIDLSSTVVIPDIALIHVHKWPTLDAEGKHQICMHYSGEIPDDSIGELFLIWDLGEYEQGELPTLNYTNSYREPWKMTGSNPPCNGEYNVRLHGYKPEQLDKVEYFRWCYKYNENGQTKFVYSPIYAFAFNDLPNE